ncbi:unnamed protein product [Rotaria sordida]|uniref:DSBA-like thioredoxin domain-containing protein n=1 Tax=Rotaria sordida TaxID=392033 RepID=A0A819UL54_9BILA|nr:unnamed protein product [Rotaria sordida]
MFPIRFIRSYTTGKTPFEPALQLEKEYPIQLRFIPWPFRVEESFGGNLQERNKLNWNKVRYGYMDVRCFANEHGLIIRGPQRIFDSRLSLMGDFQTSANNQGQQDYLNAQNEADQDSVFGVPTFIIRGELFFGNDRISWAKNRLDSVKLHDT